ncbi:MAG: hypothetical protein E5Y00_14035 [Mesorhizobium sp.]|nr:MAG: hypothetical protein E5Y00_14035 [Mesorhizobium sp.]
MREKIDGVDHEQDTSAKLSRVIECTLVKAFVLGDKEIGRVTLQGMEESGINYVIGPLQRAEFGFKIGLAQAALLAQNPVFCNFAKRYSATFRVFVA